MKNLNLLFNKTYYEKIGDSFSNNNFVESLKKNNKELFGTVFCHDVDYKASKVANEKFLLKTVYPGLLIGTGNPHGSRQSDQDINQGFSFDYVTGQPYIPGSSVKGVLRSHFKRHSEAIASILEIDVSEVQKLETEIFDGNDVFLDAVVYSGDAKGHLISSDYITPHPTATRNPVPIFFIKVLPDVRFEFRFLLQHSENISTERKRNLFKMLLEFFGIGAKTNVGYGILEECDEKIDPVKCVSMITASDENKGSKYSEKANNDYVVCTKCGKKNYKYKKDTNIVNKSWINKACFVCGEKLK